MSQSINFTINFQKRIEILTFFGTVGEAKEAANIPMKVKKKTRYSKNGIEKILVEKHF